MSAPLVTRIHQGRVQRALIVENPHPELDRLLQAQGVQTTRLPDAPRPERLAEALRETRAQVLFKRSRVVVDAALLDQAPELLAVQLCCIGDDSVDLQACADRGVLVFNDPISNNRSVVELALAQLIALSRRLFETDQDCRHGGWDKSNAERYEIQGKVLGVLGLGNIGRALARAAQGLGMEIHFHDSRAVAIELGQELGFRFRPSVEELFRGSDYLSVHLSASDVERRSNAGLLDGGVLELLGADRPEDSPRIFLNLSRGFLYEAESLRKAVLAGRIRRAAVDVYPQEPRGGGDAWVNPYEDLPRVAVSPHIGASTLEAQPRIARRVAETVASWSGFGAVRDCVFSPRAQLSVLEGPGSAGAALLVLHGTARGTKRAIDEIIFEAGSSNLASQHRDLDHLGVAIDLAALDRPLSTEALQALVERAARVTGDPRAIRSVRQISLRA